MIARRAAMPIRAIELAIQMAALMVTLPFPATGQGRSDVSMLGRFDLSRDAARRVVLPQGLREVSGLAVSPDGRLFAHGDEFGVVAQLNPKTGAIEKHFSLGSPAIRGDFEGIAIAGERFFLITSSGRLYETREGANGIGMRYTVVDTGFGKRCEIEGLAYDPSDRVLLIGCKQPLAPGRRGQVTLFRWSLTPGALASPDRLTIDLTDVDKSTGAANTRVSSVERNPGSGHYVAVAGPEWQLVELTKEGRVVAVRALNRRLHPQPEGLTFLGDSLMLVADEGGGGRAALTLYHRAK